MARTLWGSGINGNQAKPNWLTQDQKDRTYATPAGWVLHRKSGEKELLVAIRGLSLKMGIAQIEKVTWGSTAVFARSQVQTVKVRFSEQVAVTGTPTLLVSSSAGGTVTASYSGINADKNVLTFTFTTPAVATTLSIAAQTIALAGGTIFEKNVPDSQRSGSYMTGNTAPSLVITAPVLAASGRQAGTALGTKVIA